MKPEVSVVLPCKNEEKTIGLCIRRINEVFESKGINGEVIVVDNDSSDSSAEIARRLGAKVFTEKRQGYGSACMRGFSEARGNYIIMGDSDGTYDFREIPKFLEAIKGNDFVIGSRFEGEIRKDSMSWLHRYIGNPLLTRILRFLFKSKISDAHSGFRAIRKSELEKLNLRTTGMEFASEMLIKAIKNNLRIKEIPITYYPRKAHSKLNSFRDGWKHLRFMLLYSPDYLFLVPGGILFLMGFVSLTLSIFWPINIFDLSPNLLTIFGSLLTILGYQVVLLGLYSKTYAVTHLQERDEFISGFHKKVTVEKGVSLGFVIFLIGFFVGITYVYTWINGGFETSGLRIGVFALTLAVLGIQTIFSSFFLSILGIEKK
jgi:glycosyltransferase involved in cell wall biosynthesis